MKTIIEEKKVITKYKVEITELKKSIFVKSTNNKSKKIDKYFLCKKRFNELRKKHKSLFTALNKFKWNDRFYLYKDGFVGSIKENYFIDEYGFEFEKKCTIKTPNLNDINENNVIRFCSSTGEFYVVGSDIPISVARKFNYIEGHLNNRNFNISEALKKLNKLKIIKKAEITEIPYYNSEPDKDRSLDITVCLSQRQYNKLYSYVTNEIKSSYPSGAVRDLYIYKPWLHDKCPFDADYLGLKEFYIENKYRC